MAYTLKTNLANKSNYGSKRNVSNIKYIVIHYTANDGDTDESNAKYFHNNVVKASAHYFVDDDSVTQSVPDDYVAWSVGGKKYSDCAKTGGGSMYGIITNNNSISIEMCDTVKNGVHDVSDKTVENTIALAKVLMKKYSIDINHVYRHFDVTGKSCPSYYTNATAWNAFKLRLQNVLNDSYVSQIESSGTYTQEQFIANVCAILGVKTAKEALAKTPTISASSNKTNALVTPLERYMKALGYYGGSIEADSGKTPSFGSGMTNAIKKYQTYVVKFTNAKYIDGVLSANGTSWKQLLGLR